MTAADYPLAEAHFVPRSWMFNSNSHSAIVIHKTGGDATPQDVYNTFLASGRAGPGKSVHYAVGQDGSIWQFVPEALGAGGNGILDPGYDPFWEPYVREFGNLNLCTLSIEHCDPSTTNATPLTPAQQEASFKLIAYLTRKYGIPPSHIKGHNSIEPINRAHCPGNYPWQALFAYLQQQQGGGTPAAMQQYTEQSADFSHWFAAQDASHWLCKQTNCVVQFGILSCYATLSLDGNTLPVIGLPLTNEHPLAVGGKQVVLQVFERGALCYDPAHAKDSQPGMGDVYLVHLNDPDLLPLVPGLKLPAAASGGAPQEVIPATVKADAAAVLAAAQKLAHDSGLD